MMYKLFAYLSLTSALLTTMNPCFAMEPDDEDYRKITKVCLLTQVTACKTLLRDMAPMKNSPEKASHYMSLIRTLDLLGTKCLREDDGYYDLNFCLAESLASAGVVQLEFWDFGKKNKSLQDIDAFKKPIDLLRRSLKIQKSLQPLIENTGEQAVFASELATYTSRNLGDSLSILLDFYLGYMDQEKDPHRLIDLSSKAIKVYEKACVYNREETLLKWYTAHQHIFTILADIVKRKDTDLKGQDKYRELLNDISLLEKILSIANSYSHLADPIECTSKDMVIKKGQKTFPSITLRNVVLNSYCETLKNAGHAALNLDFDNAAIKQIFTDRGQQHLSLAYSIYKENTYKEEYRNDPTKEKTFIEARLESFIGNEAPLKKFYDDLIQERRELRKRQDQRQEQANAQQIKKEQQEALAQHIREQKEQANTQQPPKRREAKQPAEDNQTSPSEPSLTFCSFDETKPDLEATSSTNVKKKRRGVADPSKANQPPQKVLRNGTGPAPVVQEQPMIILHPKNYHVFLSLIGESHDRNITCDQVIHLLGNGLRCSITPGGNHRKATAQNGAEWTIPPAWDGPIHSGYRHQLMHFLLSSMELDPEFVRARGN